MRGVPWRRQRPDPARKRGEPPKAPPPPDWVRSTRPCAVHIEHVHADPCQERVQAFADELLLVALREGDGFRGARLNLEITPERAAALHSALLCVLGGSR